MGRLNRIARRVRKTASMLCCIPRVERENEQYALEYKPSPGLMGEGDAYDGSITSEVIVKSIVDEIIIMATTTSEEIIIAPEDDQIKGASAEPHRRHQPVEDDVEVTICDYIDYLIIKQLFMPYLEWKLVLDSMWKGNWWKR